MIASTFFLQKESKFTTPDNNETGKRTHFRGTIGSKINVTPKRCLLAHFEAHNNISQICYCGQISLATEGYSFSDNPIPLGG